MGLYRSQITSELSLRTGAIRGHMDETTVPGLTISVSHGFVRDLQKRLDDRPVAPFLEAHEEGLGVDLGI